MYTCAAPKWRPGAQAQGMVSVIKGRYHNVHTVTHTSHAVIMLQLQSYNIHYPATFSPFFEKEVVSTFHSSVKIQLLSIQTKTNIPKHLTKTHSIVLQ